MQNCASRRRDTSVVDATSPGLAHAVPPVRLHRDDEGVPVVSERPFDLLLQRAEMQHAACSRAQAHALGVTNKVLRTAVDRGRLVRALPDVFRIPGYPSTFEQRLMIPILGSGDEGRCVASRRSAGALHGLEGFASKVIEITLSEHRRDYRPPGVHVHSTSRWLKDDLTEVNGVPTTDIIRTIIDLAGCVPPRRLTRIIDAAERDLILDRNELEMRLETIRQSGRNGCGVLARELESRALPGRNPTTALERDFDDLLLRFGIRRPDCQIKVLLPNGGVAIVDFAWLELMLVVETDGHLAHATRAERARDAARRHQLQRRGFEVLVFTWEQVRYQPLTVIGDLRAAFDDRAAQVRDGLVELDRRLIAAWRRGDVV